MTQPEVPEELPTVPAEEVTELEAMAVLAVTGGLAGSLAAALASILAAWEAVAAGGAITPVVANALRSNAVRRIRGIEPMPGMDQVAATYGARAQAMGMGRAAEELPDKLRHRLPRLPPIRDVERPDLEAQVRQRLAEAANLAATIPLDTKANVMAVVGRASSAKALAEGTTRAVVYGGLSRGKVAVAQEVGSNLLWVPERNACLHCLAHAGWVWAPGKHLPKGLTYGDRPLKVRVKYPPLHPNCRCEAVLTALPVGGPSRDRARTDPAARLAAEARRSVVLGWTDNASQAATMRAMDRLLRQGADLPASVEQRARRALAAGQLPRRPR